MFILIILFFQIKPSGYCLGFNDVLKKYNEILKEIKLSGPTNFAPLIKETIRIVKETNQVISFILYELSSFQNINTIVFKVPYISNTSRWPSNK
jgi:hypothetical protein